MPVQSPEMVQHLSEEQLDEILMEIAEPAACAHTATCALCSTRLEEFRVAMGAFNQASLAWSEARSNALTRDLLGSRSRIALSQMARWSYGAAAVMAGGLLLTLGAQHRPGSHGARVQPATAAGSDYASSRQQEIASDNQMLAAISSEIDRPVPAPSALYGEEKEIQPRRGMMRE